MMRVISKASPSRVVCRGLAAIAAALIAAPLVVLASDAGSPSQSAEILAQDLFETGNVLSERTHYLEALEMFEESRHLLDEAGQNQTALYADVLFALARTKIKGRLHQDFPAAYVKTGLEDVQAANRLREKLPRVVPQKLAEGYFLEGFIHKRFFMRKKQAESCFDKAVKVDPGAAAAKRELSEVTASP